MYPVILDPNNNKYTFYYVLYNYIKVLINCFTVF